MCAGTARWLTISRRSRPIVPATTRGRDRFVGLQYLALADNVGNAASAATRRGQLTAMPSSQTKGRTVGAFDRLPRRGAPTCHQPTISPSSAAAPAAMSAPSRRRSSASRSRSSRRARPSAAPASTSAAFRRRRSSTPPSCSRRRATLRRLRHQGRHAEARPHGDDGAQGLGGRSQRLRRRVPVQEEQDRFLPRHRLDRRARARSRSTAGDGASQTIEAKTIVIATGSDSTPLRGVDDRRDAHRHLDRRAVACRRCRRG